MDYILNPGDRDYQLEAVAAVWAKIKKADNALVVLLMGTGKGRISAMLMMQSWRAKPDIRIDFIVNRVELLDQTVRVLGEFFTDDQLGTYTGKKKQLGRMITVGTIQSLHRVEREPPNLIILDEVHNVSDLPESAYRKYVASNYERNPKLKVVGLTATPYRSNGYIYGEKTSMFDSVTYERDLRWALEKGILVIPRMKRVEEQFDASDVKIVAGDYDQGELERLTNDLEKVRAQVADALPRLIGRKKIVWACTGIKHSELLAAVLRENGEDAVAYHSKLESRGPVMDHWKAKGRHLTFISIIKEGFDFPPIDAVCLCCPTRSPVKYLQIVGRGLRTHPDKVDCLVLDYGRVIETCGPLDKPFIRKKGEKNPKESLMKFCPQCLEYMEKTTHQCPACGYVPPPPAERDGTKALDTRHRSGAILSGEVEPPPSSWIPIRSVVIAEHKAKSGRICTKITYLPANALTKPVVEYCPWGTPKVDNIARHRLARVGVNAKKMSDIKNQVPMVPTHIKVVWEEYPRIEEMKYE